MRLPCPSSRRPCSTKPPDGSRCSAFPPGCGSCTLHDAGECTVGELAAATDIALPNVSQHLARLSAGGLVRGRRDGRAVRYRIADPTIEALCDIVCAQVKDRA